MKKQILSLTDTKCAAVKSAANYHELNMKEYILQAIDNQLIADSDFFHEFSSPNSDREALSSLSEFFIKLQK